MKLPSPLLESPYFQFRSVGDLKASLDGLLSAEELAQIDQLDVIGLPPITSRLVLAAMLGVNPGIIWSMYKRSARYYRTFEIPKGKGTRTIHAPKVGLKVIQKWLAAQLQRKYVTPDHVYGFVPGRSHLDAAQVHCGAEWVFSVDIENFFPSTPLSLVTKSLQDMGFSYDAALLLGKLCCLGDRLSQGAPSSPTLSNICFCSLDDKLIQIGREFQVKLTRYADDIVFSGTGKFPEELKQQVLEMFNNQPWKLAEHKIQFAILPNRLKVHGLLVHGDHVRLTKGYRNRVRAYQHLLSSGRVRNEDIPRISGHVSYAEFVKVFAGGRDLD